LRRKLSEGKCLLLLDALDQVPREHRNDLSEKLNGFAQNYPCSIICTSRAVRYAGGFLNGAREVEIIPFNREQIKQYVQRWFTNAASSIDSGSVSADELIPQLLRNPRIWALAQVPLLLSLLCSLYQEREHALPPRRCQIYVEAVEYMLSRWSRNRKPQSGERLSAKITLLEELAYHFTCEGKEVFSSDDLHNRTEEYLKSGRAQFGPDSTASELITELSEKDRIIKIEKDGQAYAFVHCSFQEYLTASYLRRVGNGIALAREHLWEYDWHDTLSLFAGLMEDPVPLLQMIIGERDDIFSSLLLLAGRCITECEENPNTLIVEIIDRIYKLWRIYPSVDFINSVARALGQADSRMPERLRGALNDDRIEIREAAVRILAEIGGQQMIGFLTQLLRDENSGIRRYAAWTLGRTGDRQAVEPLIQTLEDEDSSVRYYAAWALGETGDQKAVESLIHLLKGDDRDVRGAAANALSKIGSQKAVEALTQALSSEDSDVRWAAAEVLGMIASEQAIEPLMQALNDDDSEIREAAVEALGEIASPESAESLIEAIGDEDSNVGAAAARALGKIGSQRVVKPLVDALKHEDGEIRETAAEALGKIGDQRAVEPLVSILNDEDSFVRGTAADALGKIGDRRAAEGLIQLLNDAYSDVRWAAAEALGRIADPKGIEPLVRVFRDESSDVRDAAARALGRIGSQKAVDSLISALDDADQLVRQSAVVALGEIGSREAIEPLINALDHRDMEVRREAAVALGKIGSQQAAGSSTYAIKRNRRYIREASPFASDEIYGQKVIEPLIHALKDDSTAFKQDVVGALRRIGTVVALEKLLQSPIVDVYDPDIFPLARTLAVRYSKEKTSLIPVYPELVLNRPQEMR
jgi:HEAT repeat protein